MRHEQLKRSAGRWVTMVLLCLMCSACGSREPGMNDQALDDFALRYADAWSSRDPAAFAGFYDEAGWLAINDAEPAVGRAAVEQKAREFMTAFPDMVVRLIEVRRAGERVEFHWHWTGTNSGPGGTGNAVDLKGFEEWLLTADGLILKSRGHFDEDEYQRQLNAAPGAD
jgi:uncharacterized protein (TIGR02246 family)